MTALRVLVVDDDLEKALQYAQFVLARPVSTERRGIRDPIETEVAVALSAAEATDRLLVARREGRAFDVVVLDLIMSGGGGLVLLESLRTYGFSPSDLAVILVSQQQIADQHDVAIDTIAREWGAPERRFYRVFRQAFDDATTFIAAIAACIEGRLEELRTSAVTAIPEAGDAPRRAFVTNNAALREQIDILLKKVAPTDTTVLITGDSGTGKTFLAKDIHDHSLRKSRPLERVDVAVMPSGTVYSNLFGYEKGAFTGAGRSTRGALHAADGSTAFIDEIGEVPLETQTMLLRLLQERRFKRIGGTRDELIDVRFVCATNRNLKEMVEQKTFRLDLYERINVWPIHLPPLRDRREDIIDLVHLFWTSNASGIAGDEPASGELAEDALLHLQALSWPGNVRSLHTYVLRMKLHFRDTPRVTRAMLAAKLGHNDDDYVVGLSRLSSPHQRFFHRLFYDVALREAPGAAGVQQWTERVVLAALTREGPLFADEPSVALERIRRAWENHRNLCPACAELKSRRFPRSG